MAPTRTLLLWQPTGAMAPRMLGPAIGPTSLLTFAEHFRLASRGRGRLFLVDADCASFARLEVRTRTPDRLELGGQVQAFGPEASRFLRAAL